MDLSLFVREKYNDEVIRKYLSEDNISMQFSIKYKIYYHLLRPIIPIGLRQRLQRVINKNKVINKNFIYSDFVDYLKDRYDSQYQNELYPNNYDAAVVLTHDVETKDGLKYIPKIIDLENKYGMRSIWNIVPYKYRIDRGIIEYIRNCGHEVGIHGYNHDGKLYYSKETFSQRAQYINKALEEYGATGFRSPMVHRNLNWLQSLNIKYDMSCFDYDPYQPFPGGTGCIWPFYAGKIVELPYTLPQDHTLYYVLQQRSIEIWKNKSKWLIKNKGIILPITHPDYLREIALYKMYEEFLAFLQENNNLWFCLPTEMVEWYSKKGSFLPKK